MSAADPLALLRPRLAERYAVDREVGRGGMAVVYLALDRKHQRRVALKVLDPELGAVLGADRFLAEIRTTANLQHPNLLPLFDSGEVDGLLYYVMPFVEGESLRARLDREKQLPIDEAVRIATALASALDYAHRQGVIHRDLKPENVLFHDGQPLIADFGIALAVQQAGGQRVTQTGLSLGTPQYMSPEQATGDRTIDARTDIYALGAVTYEMLAGEPPHVGNTAQAVIARLMTEAPRALSTVRRAVPPHVDAAVHRALEKLPADRFATARELSDALQGRGAVTAYIAASPARRPTRLARALPWALAAVGVLVGVAGTSAWWRARYAPAPPPVRFTVEPPPGLRLGGVLALSRDGRTLAFVAGPDTRLYTRRLGDLAAAQVPDLGRVGDASFSDDGRTLAIVAASSLYRLAVSDTGTRPTPWGFFYKTGGMHWAGATELLLATADTALWRVPLHGEPRLIATVDRRTEAAWADPFMLPDGRTVALTITPRGATRGSAADRLALMSVDGGARTVVDLEVQRVLGYADGTLVYSKGGRIMAVRFDPGTRRVSGDPVSLVSGVQARAALADDGTLAYFTGTPTSRLEIVDESGTVTFALPDEGRRIFDLAWSPDGKRIAMTFDTDGRRDVWLYHDATRILTRLTESGDASDPVWTSDGRRVGFIRSLPGGNQAYWVAADGSGAPEQIPGTGAITRSVMALGFTPDGRAAVVHAATTAKGRAEPQIFVVPLAGGAPQPLLEGTELPNGPVVSPDGRWIAYMVGGGSIVVRPFAAGGGRLEVAASGSTQPRWSHDGRRLFFRGAGAFRAATLDVSGAMPRVVHVDSLFPDVYESSGGRALYDVHPDGRRLVVAREVGEGRRLVVVTNWMSEARAKLDGP